MQTGRINAFRRPRRGSSSQDFPRPVSPPKSRIPTIEMISATEMIPTTEMIPAVTTEMIPGISGVELRGLQKLDNNLVRAFYLFILHLFYGV